MKDKTRDQGGRQNRSLAALQAREPEPVASFCLSLGYDEANVVNTLVTRCNLDVPTARRIVAETARTLNQGGQQ